MRIYFACPACSRPARTDVSASADWQCPGCDHRLRLKAGAALESCPVCGNHELYKKKNFPHWLGLSILAIACFGFLLFQGLYQPRIAWAILIGVAIIDGLLYLWVGDVIVCYRCHAHVGGVAPTAEQQPYQLEIAERYRQERLRGG